MELVACVIAVVAYFVVLALIASRVARREPTTVNITRVRAAEDIPKGSLIWFSGLVGEDGCVLATAARPEALRGKK